jgi:hypothetical protein
LPVTWSAWAIRDARSPLRVIVAVVVAVLCCAGAFAMMADFEGGWVTAALMSVLLFASLEDVIVPVRFRITADGAYSSGLIRHHGIRWRNVRKAWVDADGIKLSPLSARSRLETFRGVYLRFNPARGVTREQLAPIVKGLRDAAQGRSPDAEAGSESA